MILESQLDRSADWTSRYPRQLGLAATLIAGGLSAGVFRLEIETDFTKNFRARSPIVQSYEMVETHLGGAGVLDVILPAPPRLDWEYLQRVWHLEQRLRGEVAATSGDLDDPSRLTKVISLADTVVGTVPPVVARITPKWLLDQGVAKGIGMMEERMPEFFHALYGEDPHQPGQHYLRVMLRARERQPSEAKRRLVEQVEQICHEEFPESEVTGLFVLLTRLIDSVSRDQWLTFSLAVLGVGGMMVLAFRSVALALIALVPNTVPILIVLGSMGWVGIRINLGAAMIAAVSMGLSVDSSIHYITSFRRARAEGKSVEEALHTVQHTVGRAMVFSTLALVVGFSALCASQFVPTIYFGILVGLAMLGGLAGNLVVLPLLLMTFRLAPDAAKNSSTIHGRM
jgi:predicted RND superfamily exporter protein